MKTRHVSLWIVGLLATTALVNAQQPPLHPNGDASQGPVYVYPNGIYSPYPGIWAPVPYPGWGYPPHWIYSYMFTDPAYRRPARNLDNETGKTYPGRDTLSPAVPYADYLKDQKELLKAREIAAKPAPTADKALLEIHLPTEKAKLFFDGKEASGEGETRTFLTPPLKSGESYIFNVKATWAGFPDDFSSEQTVTFRAGDHKKVDLREKK
jgi:uncharacterized protein (TIGR03000 family)